MKNRHFTRSVCLIMVLTIAGTFFGCEQKAADIVKEPYTEVQSKIINMVTDIFNAAKAKDFAKLDAFHLNSPKFTKFDNQVSPKRQNYEENKIGEEAVFNMLEGVDFKLHDVKVDVFDKVAISTFVISFTAKVQGTMLADTSRGTLVFVDYENKWCITHEHFSKFK